MKLFKTIQILMSVFFTVFVLSLHASADELDATIDVVQLDDSSIMETITESIDIESDSLDIISDSALESKAHFAMADADVMSVDSSLKMHDTDSISDTDINSMHEEISTTVEDASSMHSELVETTSDATFQMHENILQESTDGLLSSEDSYTAIENSRQELDSASTSLNDAVETHNEIHNELNASL